MSQPTGAVAPRVLRIVESTAGKSLIVAFPLILRLKLPQRTPLPKSTTVLRLYSRAFWLSNVYSPRLKIGMSIRGLGLKQLNNSGHGKVSFQFDNLSQLSDAVAEAVTRLPHTRDKLVNIASDHTQEPLRGEVAQLLHRFGNDIWGAGKERTWLLKASESHVEYQKDLSFEDAGDRDVMAYYIRLWILTKAFNAIRNSHARARLPSQANTNRRKNGTFAGPGGNSSPPPPHAQAHTAGDAHRVTTDPIVLPTSDWLLVASEQTTHATTNGPQVCRTARTPKPRQQSDTVDSTSHSALDEQLQSESDPNVPRYYKGKGRVWRKTMFDEDPGFDVVEDGKANMPRAGNIQPGRVLGRPKGTKNKEVLSEQNTRESNDDAVMWTNHREDHSRRIGMEPLLAPARASVLTQDHMGNHRQQEVSRQKRKRRPSRKYLSEEVIRNSSDESEESNILTLSSTTETVASALDNNTPTSTSRLARQRLSSGNNLAVTESTLESRSSQHATSLPERSFSAMPLGRRSLSMVEYWNEEAWRYHYLRGNERIALLQTMQSLGLNVVLKHPVHFKYDKKDFTALDDDVNTIAEQLSDQFSANQLIHNAADSNYLNEQIDGLFVTHSPMWSLDADRSQMLYAGVNEIYPKHLFYEESEDQKILWIHLHRWIFILALRNCRRMWGPKISDMDKVSKDANTEVPRDMIGEYQLEQPYTWAVPDESPYASGGSTGSASPERGEVAERTLKDCEQDLLEVIGRFFDNEKIGRHEDENSDILLAPSPAPAPKRRKLDPINATNGADLNALFLSYLELYNDPHFDELAALKNLARECSLLEKHATRFHTRKGIDFATAFFVVCFPGWLLYRQAIVHVKRKFGSMQDSQEAMEHQVTVIERSRLATELRKAHEVFMAAGYDGLRPEQVIHRAFITLQNEHANSQTAEDIRMGFRGMEMDLKALGDELMDGGARWILGDLGSVTELKGLRPHVHIHRGLFHRNYP